MGFKKNKKKKCICPSRNLLPTLFFSQNNSKVPSHSGIVTVTVTISVVEPCIICCCPTLHKQCHLFLPKSSWHLKYDVAALQKSLQACAILHQVWAHHQDHELASADRIHVNSFPDCHRNRFDDLRAV